MLKIFIGVLQAGLVILKLLGLLRISWWQILMRYGLPQYRRGLKLKVSFSLIKSRYGLPQYRRGLKLEYCHLDSNIDDMDYLNIEED